MTTKVLYIQSQALVGADSRVHLSLMKHLPRDRFEVHCAVATGSRELTASGRAVSSLSDVHVRPTNFGPSLDGLAGRELLRDVVLQGAPAIPSLVGLAAYIRRRRIDIVHCGDRPRDAYYGSLLARLGGARCLIHVHVKAEPWIKSFVQRAMHRADALVGVSAFVAGSLSQMGFDASKIHAVPNGLELSDWLEVRYERSDGRAEFGIGRDTPLLVTTSRLFRWKGQHLILGALPAVKRRFPDVKLLIVGTDDERAQRGSASYSGELRNLVRELELGDSVVFTGWRSDVGRLLAAGDVFVLPSFEEPFGLVYLEAMVMRRPVVALDNGGAREIIDHGGSGFLSPVDDVDELGVNITRLLADPQLRRRMGEHGRQRVIDDFSAAAMTKRFVDIYDHLAVRQ